MFTLGMDFFLCFSLHFDHQQVSECFISVSDEDHGIILLAFRHVSDIIRPMVTRKRKTTYLHACDSYDSYSLRGASPSNASFMETAQARVVASHQR